MQPRYIMESGNVYSIIETPNVTYRKVSLVRLAKTPGGRVFMLLLDKSLLAQTV